MHVIVRFGLRALVAVALLVALARPAAAQTSAGGEFLVGTGSVVCSLLWGPAKIVYAVLGGVVGGLAFVLTGGRGDTARSILQPALRGDYVVTPANLRGQRPISFVGRDPLNEPYPYE